MSTIVGTRDAVAALLQPLTLDDTLVIVYAGQQERFDDPDPNAVLFPCAEVIPGRGAVAHAGTQGILERRLTFNGAVRVSVERFTDLPGEEAKVWPLVDAVLAAFRDAPRLDGTYDVFDATGWGDATAEKVGEKTTVYVDVGWAAVDREPGTYDQGL